MREVVLAHAVNTYRGLEMTACEKLHASAALTPIPTRLKVAGTLSIADISISDISIADISIADISIADISRYFNSRY